MRLAFCFDTSVLCCMRVRRRRIPRCAGCISNSSVQILWSSGSDQAETSAVDVLAPLDERLLRFSRYPLFYVASRTMQLRSPLSEARHSKHSPGMYCRRRLTFPSSWMRWMHLQIERANFVVKQFTSRFVNPTGTETKAGATTSAPSAQRSPLLVGRKKKRSAGSAKD